MGVLAPNLVDSAAGAHAWRGGMLWLLVVAGVAACAPQAAKAYTVSVCDPVGGTVSPSPGNHSYSFLSRVSIEATPLTGWRFVRWNSSDGVTVDTPTGRITNMTVTGNGTLCPMFEKIMFKVTICTPTNGTVSPSPGDHNYQYGLTIVITATPAPCYRFVRWNFSGNVSVANPTGANTTMTLIGDGTLCPVFEKITYTVTVCVFGYDGTATPGPGAHTYDCGSSVSITATPSAGYRFVGWDFTGGVSVANHTGQNTTMTVNGNGTLCPMFAEMTYTVTVCTPTNGTVSPSPGDHTYDGGASVSITATADECYRFVRWNSSGGVSVANPTGRNTTMTVNGNGTLCPTFERVTYTITICPPTGGTVSPAPGDHTYNCGSTASITATPAPCYKFKRWDWSGPTVTVTNPTAASTTMTIHGPGLSSDPTGGRVCPVFEKITYTVTVCTPTNGTVSLSPGDHTYDCGSSIVIDATPAAGYKFTLWNVTGGVSVANPTGAHTTMTVSGDGRLCPEFAPGGGESGTMGLVAHWPMNENRGTLVADVAGGFDGTIMGNVVWTQGETGCALKFPGVRANNVNVGNVAINLGSNFTLAGWIKLPPVLTRHTILAKGSEDSGHYELYINNVRVPGEAAAYLPDLGDFWSGIRVDDDTWHHIAWTYDGRTVTCYVDGGVTGLKAWSVPGRAVAPETEQFRIGSLVDGTNPFGGEIDDVRIYNLTLSAEEIVTAMIPSSGTPVPGTETPGAMTLTGDGSDIWNTADDFVFAYKTLTGDGSLIARVMSVGTGSNAWAKAGAMIRNSLTAGSAFVDMVMTGGDGNGAAFQYRPVANGECGNANSWTVVAPPYWVKIERVGNVITGSYSADGQTWTTVGAPQYIAMATSAYIGLCVTSHQSGEQRTFQFDNISTAGGVSGEWQQVQIKGSR